MNAISKFWNSSIAGIALLGCLSLLIFLSLCIILAGMYRPTLQAPAPTQTATHPVSTESMFPSGTAENLPAAVESIQPTSTSFLLPTATLPVTATMTATASPYPTSRQSDATPGTSCVPGNQPQVARVVDVIDGDTISVFLDGLVVKVRYIGIDAPESVSRLQYLGKEAKARNRELVSGREVLLYKDVSDRDRFDRLLRYVFIEDKFINYELISQGFAAALDEPPDSACALLLQDAETKVKEKALGIWAPHTALPELSAVSGSVIIYTVNKEGEFVDIQNVGDIALDLKGWKLVSEQGNQDCELEGVIHPSEIVRIFSGSNQPGFSCGYEGPIWNDREPDPAVLYDPDGNEVDRYP